MGRSALRYTLGFIPVLGVLGVMTWSTFVFLSFSFIPLAEKGYAVAYPMLCVYALLLIPLTIAYFRTIFVRPGSIPIWFAEADGPDDIPVVHAATEGSPNSHVTQGTERKKDGARRYCRKCRKWKPDRSHHCSSCGECVLKMDHHCPWVNNCVGFRNYSFFFQFVCYCVFLVFYGVMCLVWRCKDALTNSMSNMSSDDLYVIVTVAILLVLECCLIGFIIFHFLLLKHNFTTIEWLEKRGANGGYVNPYDLDLKRNVETVLGKSKLLRFLPFGTPPKADEGVFFETNLGSTKI